MATCDKQGIIYLHTKSIIHTTKKFIIGMIIIYNGAWKSSFKCKSAMSLNVLIKYRSENPHIIYFRVRLRTKILARILVDINFANDTRDRGDYSV